MFKDFNGAKVVISGAGNGVGKALALGFASRGADVAVLDIHGGEAEATAAEIRGMGAGPSRCRPTYPFSPTATVLSTP